MAKQPSPSRKSNQTPEKSASTKKPPMPRTSLKADDLASPKNSSTLARKSEEPPQKARQGSAPVRNTPATPKTIDLETLDYIKGLLLDIIQERTELKNKLRENQAREEEIVHYMKDLLKQSRQPVDPDLAFKQKSEKILSS